MTDMPKTPLPLSEQIIAWVLQALGYEELSAHDVSRSVSHSTIKSAQRGAIISRSWLDLVGGVLELLGRDPEAHRGEVQQALEHWDEMVAKLPPDNGLSLAERLHALLIRAIPEVGIRLGALAALLSLSTKEPLDKWLWLVEPLDGRIFGKVVLTLFRLRFPDKTREQIRGLLEHGDGVEEKKVVDWRTVERWRSGATKVPEVEVLVRLGEILGEDAEPILRIARLAARFHQSLCKWIGDDAADEWTRAVADVAQTMAPAFSDPAQIAILLKELQISLTSSIGEDMHQFLRPLLPPNAQEWSRHALAERVAEAAQRCEAGSMEDAIALWLVTSTLSCGRSMLVPIVLSRIDYVPHPLHVASFDRYVHLDWNLRVAMKALANPNASLKRGDGSIIEISEVQREAIRGWEQASLRFLADEQDPMQDVHIWSAFVEAFGQKAIDGFMSRSQRGIDPLGLLVDPTVEEKLPEETVRTSLPLSLARARRLLKRGDWDGARPWFPNLRKLEGPLSGSEVEGLMAIWAAIAHHMIGAYSRLRRLLRTLSNRNEEQVRALLANLDLSVPLGVIAKLVEDILETGEAVGARLEALVHALPVAIRATLLCGELGCEHERLNDEALGHLGEELRQRVEEHRTHGPGWALLAIWYNLSEQPEEEAATKCAVHFGAGRFSKRNGRESKMISDYSMKATV
jgi:hypothetical protein